MNGVRDQDLLDSGLSRAFQTFDGIDLYPGIHEKAAAVIESILINHPFIDGNKRTGYGLMRIYLAINKYEITASLENRYDFVINIAVGLLKFDQILLWLRKNTKLVE